MAKFNDHNFMIVIVSIIIIIIIDHSNIKVKVFNHHTINMDNFIINIINSSHTNMLPVIAISLVIIHNCHIIINKSYLLPYLISNYIILIDYYAINITISLYYTFSLSSFLLH